MVENLPPGFRFHPTDDELITYYLNQKLSDASFTSKAISVVDLNKNEPWDLPAKASMGEKEWYFFSLKDRKYPTGLRTNRATEAGYWKTTGKDKEIFCVVGVLVGMKKTLVFYKGRAPRGEKTNWVMHEYRQHNNNNNHLLKPSKDEWVVCRVFQKSNAAAKKQTSSSQQTSMESPSPCDTVNEFGDHIIEFPNLNNSSSDHHHHHFSNNIISTQTPPCSYGNSNTTTMNIMNWNNNNYNTSINAINPVSSDSSWPAPAAAAAAASTLLNSNLSVNSLLLKALQLRNFQHRDDILASSSSSGYSYSYYNNNNITNIIPQGHQGHQDHGQSLLDINNNNNNVISQYGTHDHLSLFQAAAAASPSSSPSSKLLDSSSVQQPQEQPLNLDSIW